MKKLRNFWKPYTMWFLKELLLWSILLFWFISFSNAQLTSTENITQEYTTYNYWITSLTEWITYTVVNLNDWPLKYQPCANSSCSVRRNNSVSSSYVISSSDISPQLQCYWSWPCKFSVSYIQKSEIVPVSSLSPVIEWLTSTINEFIPLVVYIWLGVLGAVIWFVAIKWLINRLRSKTLSPFKK